VILVKKLKWCPERVEPTERNRKQIETAADANKSEIVDPRSSPRISGYDGTDVAKVVLAWASLRPDLRAAILAIIAGASGGQST